MPDGLLLVATIIGWSIAIEALAYRYLAVGRLAKPRPKPLIEDGVLNGQVMRREFITRDEVMAQLRLHGITELDQVARAYFEGSGLISVVRRDRDPTGEAPQPPPGIR